MAFSLRWKITLPYMLLALVLGLGATLLVNRLFAEREQERFLLLLGDSGQQAADGVVRVERDLLEVERLVANTTGLLEGVAASDAEGLRQLVLPVVVNAEMDMVVVVDSGGTSLVAMRHIPGGAQGEYETPLRGETFYAQWAAVQEVLGGGGGTEGEKVAGLEPLQVSGQPVRVFFVGGPLRQADGRTVGAVLVGLYVDSLTVTLKEVAAANISVYDRSGVLVGSTLEPDAPEALTLPEAVLATVTAAQPNQSPVRRIDVSGQPYGEVLIPFLARQGDERLGVLGVSLLERSIPVTTNLSMIVLFGALALILVVVIGLLVSNSITRPLVTIAAASTQVATGDLEARVPEGGADEIGVLARTFNRMVAGLREGLMYHDLLGRAVAPEVRDQLQRSMVGDLEAVRPHILRATILFVGLQNRSGWEDDAEAGRMLEALNAFLAGALPRIAQHGGVVDRFDGDELLAYFGILPRALPPAVSALQATHAGVELLELIRDLNEDGEDHQRIDISIGVATGRVVAGGLGTRDRLQYTLIGDTVTLAEQLQDVARDSGVSRLIVSETTHRALGTARSHFVFGRYGQIQVKGRTKPVVIHEVTGRTVHLFERMPKEFWDKTTDPLNPSFSQ
ncbi:MAG TPA: adenylate/guanylate cyclase domain-containing protein [Anaerolineales bacterium]|nr:adenylate/guanylate cyclase domain-containing protein [Anaerolineales bacterium]